MASNWSRLVAPKAAASQGGFTASDVDAALAHYNQVLDVSRADLEGLLHLAGRAAFQRTLGELRCADIMSRPPYAVEAGVSFKEAWALMRRKQITALPVVDAQRPVIGIVTVEAFLMLFGGWRSVRIGRRAVYAIGSVSLALFAFPVFCLRDTHQPRRVDRSLVLGLPFSHAAMIGTQPALMGELFPTHVRYTGLAMGHEIASIFAGGLAPLVATALFAVYRDAWPVSLMLVFFSVITTLTLLSISRNRPYAMQEASA